jgi:drug/metabolite transporter (DMT)-like permease
VAIILAVGFDLTAIASIGSAVALVVFTLVTAGHLRVRAETGARASVLVLAIAATVVVLISLPSLPWSRSRQPPRPWR